MSVSAPVIHPLPLSETERRAVETAFRAFDQIPIGICVLRHDHLILYWNSQLELWTGLGRSQVIGQSTRLYIPAFSQPHYRLRLQQVFEQGQTVVFSPELHPHLIRAPAPNGVWRTQKVTIMPVPAFDASGFYAVVSVQDLTDLVHQNQFYRRSQAEVWGAAQEHQRILAEQRHDRAFLNGILQTSIAAIVVLDASGQIIFVNERLETLLGIDRSQLLGHPYNDPLWRIMDTEDHGLLLFEELPFQDILQSGKPILNLRQVIYQPNGQKRILLMNGAPLRNSEGQITEVVVSIVDITAYQDPKDWEGILYEVNSLG